LPGQLDQVLIYDQALDVKQVQELASPANLAPTVATAAAVSPSPVTGTTATLSALGADDAGAAALTYTWATTGTPPAAVTFSANGTNSAQEHDGDVHQGRRFQLPGDDPKRRQSDGDQRGLGDGEQDPRRRSRSPPPPRR